MNTTLISNNGSSYIQCQPGWQLATYQDVIDLIQVCAENGTDRFLIQAANLPDAFYDLRSGLAGMILDRLSVYQVRAGFVIPAEKLTSGRFAEMALESNRGFEYHYSSSLDEVVLWLENL